MQILGCSDQNYDLMLARMFVSLSNVCEVNFVSPLHSMISKLLIRTGEHHGNRSLTLTCGHHLSISFSKGCDVTALSKRLDGPHFYTNKRVSVHKSLQQLGPDPFSTAVITLAVTLLKLPMTSTY